MLRTNNISIKLENITQAGSILEYKEPTILKSLPDFLKEIKVLEIEEQKLEEQYMIENGEKLAKLSKQITQQT